MKIGRIERYLVGISLPAAVAMFSPSALAEEASAPVAATPASKTATTDVGAISDIVVTAQRRAQKIQDVPIAISAITAQSADAAGVTGTTSLQATVPALAIIRQANGAAPFLRGIGASLGDANAEGSVAIYLDGVYQPSAFGNFFDLADIDRVEVLKGPQGTLFGRNSTGGVIQVITKDPSPDLQGKLSLGYANYNTVTANGYLSVPITQDIALNGSVYYQNRADGWGTNIFTGKQTPGANTFAARSKLKITPDADTKIVISGNYSTYRDGALNGQAPEGLAHETTISQFPGDYNTDSNFTDSSNTKSYGGSVHIDRDFGTFRVASITAYEKTTGVWNLDFDATPLQLIDASLSESSKMFSQEIHILSRATSKLQWLIGGYYYFRDAGFVPERLRGLAFAPLPGVDISGISASRSRSLFGQATYPIFEDTNVTGGFRYSWETANGMGGTYLPGTNIVIDTPDGKPATGHLAYSKPTWRLSFDHKFEPDLLGYISYNRGIKSGNFGLSAGAAGFAKAYLPEQIDAYETGIKGEFFGRRLRVNAAAFYYSFKNYQFQRLVAGTAFIFNGPSATVYGGEIEIEARPTNRLTLNSNLSLLHSKLGSFPNAPNSCIAPSGASDNGGVCAPGTFAQLPGPTQPYNAQGTPLIVAPPVTANGGFIYNYPTQYGDFSASSNLYYYGGSSAVIGDRLRYGKYTTLSATLGWTNSDKTLSAKIWGKNLTKAYYYSQISVAPGLSDLVSPGDPRTYGVTVGYTFH